ncbi:MAG: chromosome segregation protein SMC, partial [Candidatus Omnitrophica bacterium]|nr:chromosome segregation protein SMC [Candidatus Omnitrophota bacterium]
MYFKKLELYGFKSFVDKTTLFFEPGVTAIVGPNGTGKSNISDAIKWVLGEQSAKSMRGSKMEDVIFNGTETRPPVNMSEVSLTLSNEGRLLPIDYDEVTITRRLYRSGESEYLLNKTLVRLKDINDMLMGTGIGTESYSLLEQGRIDAILSSKPEERRVVFEEASGITRYKKQKNEALRKLEATEENLLRVNDIVIEVTRQLNSIQRQVSKARRYQEQFEQLKTLDMQYIYREYSLLNGQRETLGNEESALRSQQSEIETALSGLSQAFENLRGTLAGVEQEYNQVHAKVLNASTQVEKNTDRINLNKERIGEFSQRCAALSADIGNAQKRIGELEEQYAQLQSRLAAFQEEKNAKESNLNLKQNAIAEIETQIKETQSSMERSRQAAVNLLAEHAQIKNDLGKLSANIHNAQARLLRLRQEQEKTVSELARIDTVLRDKTQELVLLKGKVSDEETQALALRARYDTLNREIKEIEEQLQESKQALVARQSQLDMLEQLSRSYEGFSSAVKDLMLKRNDFPSVFGGVHDVLVNLIDVEHGYELCVETALADNLQAVVVDTMADAVRLRDFLAEQSIGKVKFIALDALPAGETAAAVPGELRPLNSVVSCQDCYRGLLAYLLRNTFAVDDLSKVIPRAVIVSEPPVAFIYNAEQAQTVEVVGDFNGWNSAPENRLERAAGDIWKKEYVLPAGRYRYKFVVDGRWIPDPLNACTETDATGNVNSVVEVFAPKARTVCGEVSIDAAARVVSLNGETYAPAELSSRPRVEQQNGLIAQKAQMRQLREEIETIEHSIVGYKDSEERRRQQRTVMEIELTQLNDIINKERIVVANRGSECSNIESDKRKLDEELSVVNLEIDETTLDEKEWVSKEIDKKERLEFIDRETRSHEQSMARFQEIISLKTQEREEMLLVAAEMKTELGLLDEQESSLRENCSMVAHTLEEQRGNIKEFVRQEEDSKRRIEELTVQVEELRNNIVVFEQEKREAETALERIAAQRATLIADFENIQRQIKDKETVLNSVKNNLRDLDVKKVEINFKLEGLTGSMQQLYKTDVREMVMDLPEGVDWERQKQEIDELKAKSDRIGAVNLAAVEEEQELRERADFLNSQRDDLIAAKQTLMQA